MSESHRAAMPAAWLTASAATTEPHTINLSIHPAALLSSEHRVIPQSPASSSTQTLPAADHAGQASTDSTASLQSPCSSLPGVQPGVLPVLSRDVQGSAKRQSLKTSTLAPLAALCQLLVEVLLVHQHVLPAIRVCGGQDLGADAGHGSCTTHRHGHMWQYCTGAGSVQTLVNG